jgi:hypothetical protein
MGLFQGKHKLVQLFSVCCRNSLHTATLLCLTATRFLWIILIIKTDTWHEMEIEQKKFQLKVNYD